MSTVLTGLSAQLDALLLPLLDLLDETSDGLRGGAGRPIGDDGEASAGAAALVPRLAGLGESLRTLRDKVAEQRSHVLLFGPLKSGKSTLMNALAAAYVSEVTSLPAYPCMVYVGHAPELEVALTRWDGSEERFASLDDMRRHIAAAHGALARALRACEAERIDFHPAEHLPTAIRRVDVRIPAQRLLESGTVLVDTPGLYTRMKFGYDQLTREIRLASTSAIFVVKTDNLFLEQVFAEFDDLLRLFSRIFLVVNLDSAKRDLEPDGRLGPSLERRDPAQILAAFEELAMSETLRRARDEGRLQIYPIDLLQAASARLRSGAGVGTAPRSDLEESTEGPGADGVGEAIAQARDVGAEVAADPAAAPRSDTAAESGVQAVSSAAAEPSAAAETAAAPPAAAASASEDDVPADFARFLSDLMSYLNGQEAMVAFVRDSIHQANDLLAELATVCRGDAAAAVARLVDAAEAERARCAGRAAAARRLRTQALDAGFAPLREDVTSITRERSVEVRKQALDRAEAALDRWFETDRSWAQLVGEDLVEVFAGCRNQLDALAAEAARTVLGSDVAAAALRQIAPDDFAALDPPVAAIVREALVDVPAAESGKSALVTIPQSIVPVRRGLLDWLLLRGPGRVRRALFGAEEAPSKPVPRLVKQKRLGAPARAALGAAVRVRLDRFFADALAQCAITAFGVATTAGAARLRAAIADRGKEAEAATDEVQAILARRAAVRVAVDLLGRTAEVAAAATDGLLHEHGAEPSLRPEATASSGSAPAVGDAGVVESEPAAVEGPADEG